MSLSKQLYLIIAIIFFIIFSGNFLISIFNMKDYLEVESSTKAQDTATSIGMSLRPLLKDKQDPEIESIIRAISNSGFYKEIRLEDANFTVTSNELIGASTDLDDSSWEIGSISVDPKFGYIEKVTSDKNLNDQLLKLEGESEDLGFEEEIPENKYRYVPSALYKDGGNITFNFTASKEDKKIDTFANLEINKILITENRDIKFESVPEWFIRMISIDLEEKFSEISDGWNTSAIIYVSPNPGEAYAKLYEQAKYSTAYAVVAFIISMIILLVFVQFLLRPLKKIEALAKNISKGNFGVIEPLPWTTEIKNVSIAMNDMSRKIETMISKLTRNLESLSKKLSEDELTGLGLKQTLETDIKQMFLKRELGYIFKIKIDNLATFAKTHTNGEVENYIVRFSEILKDIKEDKSLNSKAYRFLGSEFVLVMKNCDYVCANNVAKKLKRDFEVLGEEFTLTEIAHIGATPFNELGTIDQMLQSANEAYEKAKLIGPNEFFIREKTKLSRDMTQWRDLITDIIDNANFEIDFVNDTFKLDSEEKTIIMQEAFANVKDRENNDIPIGSFVSIAEKYEKIIHFDKAVIKKVITYIIINSVNHNMIINLSLNSISDKTFILWLQKELSKNRAIASQLLFSVTAYSVAKDTAVFKNFCDYIHNSGAKIIIKRFESRFISTDNLKEFNLDYIRLARDYTSNILEDNSKKEFIGSISELGHLLNINVIAENVKDDSDLEIIKEIGIYGASR